MLHRLSCVLLAAAFASQCPAAPADAPKALKARQNAPAINPANNVWPGRTRGPIVLDLPTGVAASGPPGVSGAPYPTNNLIGYNGQPVSGDAVVPSPTLIPAQTADASQGLILNFQTVQAPQPIRGSTGKSGGTDDEAVGKCYAKTKTYERVPPS